MKLLIKKSFLHGEKVEDIVTKDIVSAKRKTVDSKKKIVGARFVFLFYPFWYSLCGSIPATYIKSFFFS